MTDIGMQERLQTDAALINTGIVGVSYLTCQRRH
jgi:hypothetical protein